MRYTVLLFCTLLVGCDELTGTNSCPRIVQPGIVVEVRDARTGDNISPGSHGTVTDGLFVDEFAPYELRSLPPVVVSLQAAIGRGGTYDVQIESPGYAPWSRTAVRAYIDGCGVITTRLRADLTPAT